MARWRSKAARELWWPEMRATGSCSTRGPLEGGEGRSTTEDDDGRRWELTEEVKKWP
jgi:hypothetical protein